MKKILKMIILLSGLLSAAGLAAQNKVTAVLLDSSNTYYKQLRNGLWNTIKFVLYSVPFCILVPLTLAVALLNYTSYQITTAIGITACLSGIFFIAGLLYPEVFERISGILMLSLIGLIVAETIAMIFFHANQSVFDYIAIAIFCGFIGFDSYKMAMDEPTVPNAIFHASDIYVDIANILLRVLRILNSDN